MAKANITANFINKLKLDGVEKDYWDNTLIGFGVSAKRKSASYVLKYRDKYGKSQKWTIGKVGKITADEARTLAKQGLGKIAHGGNPARDKMKDKSVKSVAEVCELYIVNGMKLKKSKTIEGDIGRIRHHIIPLIGKEPIESVHKGMVSAMMTDIMDGNKIKKVCMSGKKRGCIRVVGGKTAASRTVQLLSAIFTYAIDNQFVKENPCKGVKRPKDNERDVYFTDNDYKKFGEILSLPHWKMFNESQYNAIIALILSGCRKDEIQTLKWKYIDWNENAFHFPDTKTGKQTRYFGSRIKDFLLELRQTATSEYVFPSKDRQKPITNTLNVFKRMLNTIGDDGKPILVKPGMTIHGLRHSFATKAGDLGVQEAIIGGMIGHSKGKSVTRRYVHNLTPENIRFNADMVSQHITNALACINQ